MKKLVALPVLAMAFGFFAIGDSCRAAIVFDNGDHLDTANQSSQGYENADDFSFINDTLITDVHWKGVYGATIATGADDFTIRIYADNGSGFPTAPVTGSAIYSSAAGTLNRTPSGDPLLLDQYTVYSYSATITPFVALSGTNYWLSIYNNAINDYWYWTFDYAAGNSVLGAQGSSWGLQNYAFTFQLTNDAIGTVPEAASLIVWSVLIGLGLIAKLKLSHSLQRN